MICRRGPRGLARTCAGPRPATTVELKVGITADLLRQQERGRLDLVFGKQCSRAERSGTLLWEEPLVWAFAAEPPLPLAAFPKPCVYRESAVRAQGKTDRVWRIAFESGSMAGCLSAARAGFAIMVIADSQRGLRDR